MLDSIDTEYIELTAGSCEHADPALGAWFAEAIRLMVEASDRVASGDLHAALSSLAAVPRVHSMLFETCSQLLEQADDAEPDVLSTGLYL